LGIIAITVAAWLSISNHCALAAIRKSSGSHMSCHEKSHSPAKQSEDAPCCKVLRANFAKTSQPGVDLLIHIGQICFVESILFPQQQRLLGNPLALDTGPPFSASHDCLGRLQSAAGAGCELVERFVWGQNHDTGEGKTQSFLLESNFQRGRDTVYGRIEYVEKSEHELVLSGADLEKVFGVGGYTIGYVRDLIHGSSIDLGLGGQFTINTRSGSLDPYYGDDLAYGFQVFLRLRPSRMVDMKHGMPMKPEAK